MRKLHLAAVSAAIAASVLFSASASAVPPTNPSFEDEPDLDTWTVVNSIYAVPGTGWVVRDEDPTDGDAFGRLSFVGYGGCGSTSYGPSFQSSDFSAGAGEEVSVDWRIRALGGFGCNGGDPGTGDEAVGRAFLMDALTDLAVETFFDTSATPLCGVSEWDTSSVIVPADGDYYLMLEVGSYDSTGGCLVGAQMDVDNVLANAPPDCTEALATPSKLWPPNHSFHDIEVVGVTDPDGDAFDITIDSVFQDEFTNTANDGDTCPDAMGIGTDTASVMAERYGGEYGYEGDGRMYWINFSATDEFGASCTGTVRVGVPHDKKEPVGDQGPLFDSTVCP